MREPEKDAGLVLTVAPSPARGAEEIGCRKAPPTAFGWEAREAAASLLQPTEAAAVRTLKHPAQIRGSETEVAMV
jgi:hypothetical protein